MVMTEKQLYALKNYMDIRIEYMISRRLGVPTGESFQYQNIERQFDEIMLKEEITAA